MAQNHYKGFPPLNDSVKALNSESEFSCLLERSSLNLSPSSTDVSEEQLDHLLAGYNYELPQERIAQNPAFPRDNARLLVVSEKHHTHGIFRDLPSWLKPGDLLVMNNTQVIPARLYGRKPSGASVEVLLLEEQDDDTWLALVKPGKRLQPGARIFFESQKTKEQGCRGAEVQGEQGSKETLSLHSSILLSATVLGKDEATGGRLLQFDVPFGVSLMQLLDSFGQMPLPPYIKDSQADFAQYQTVYAQQPGAIAAPTAGLHFTPELLNQLQERGIKQAFVTLHVGMGTFRQVEVEDVTTHKMHREWVEVPAETVTQIRETQSQGGRIIAVGTTAVRAIEGAAASGQLQPFCGKTNLFIYPGYQWRVVEGLITNFHLPRSSLLMLVSALIGRQRLMTLYQEAIASEYRFYSFGDAMLILPEAISR